MLLPYLYILVRYALYNTYRWPFTSQYSHGICPVNMDSETFQLQKGDREIPRLLLQYSYYLNKSGTKQIITGFDSVSFKAYIVFISFSDRKFIYITPDNWRFFVQCIAASCDYLNKLTDVFELRQSDDTILHVCSYNNEFNPDDRYICLHDLVYNSRIYFNLGEIEVLNKLTYYLSLMINHLDNRWGFIKEFYRTYLFKCFSRNIDHLNEHQLFKIDSGLHVNYLRLFHEIPVLCSDKLKFDLQELREGGI